MKKEYIIRFTNIILVSHEKEDYDKMKSFGFQKITWFKSPAFAYEYFKDKKEKLKEYSVYFEHAKRGITHVELRNLLWENKENILRVELYQYKMDYKEELLLKKVRMHKVDIYQEEKPEELTKWYILNGEKHPFINHTQICKQILAFLQEKDWEVSKKDLQILYVDYFLEINKLILEMRLKNQGWNVTFLDLCEKIENLGKYDIVIAKSGFSAESIEKETKHLFFKAIYEVSQDADVNANFPLSYTIGKVMHIKGITNKEVLKEEYRLTNVDKESEILSLLHSTSSLMLKMGNGKSKEKIKSSIDYDREYLRKGKEVLELQRKRNEPYINFEMLIKLLKTCYEREIFEYVTWDENRLYVEKLPNKEGFYIEYYYKNNLYGTLRLPLNSETYMKTFEMQTLTKKGKLAPSKRVGIYSKKYGVKEDMPPRMNEKELAFYNAVWLKAFRVFPNAIEKRKEQIAVLKLMRDKN